jgi:hypothetical protein
LHRASIRHSIAPVKPESRPGACDLFEVVSPSDRFHNAVLVRRRDVRDKWGDAMDILFSVISVQTFWKIWVFLHFAVAVALLAAITLQAAAVLLPAPQVAGGPVGPFRPLLTAPSATLIVILYVVQALLGAWIYIKYRTYVRIPLEGLRHWWSVGAFEFKEHTITMGLALLPAYWYFWRDPSSQEYATIRKWLTVFLALSVWYGVAVGHVVNDFRGVGS